MKCRNEGCQNKKAPDRAECASCRGKRRRGTNHVTRWKSDGSPRILFLDIETAPDLAWVWGLWDQNVGINQIKESSEMLCFSARWYGSDNMLYYSKQKDGKLRMAYEAWQLLNEADIIVHYFGSRFDIPWLNRTFLLEGWGPPQPFKQVDLKLAISRQFRFTSNKLQHVSTQLGLPGKVEHEGFDLWRKCMEGDEDAWRRMEEYNKQDVILLEELYEILLPWLPNHPNRNLYSGQGGCPRCGSHEALKEEGIARTSLSAFQQYRCHSCGSFFRSNRRLNGVKIQDSIL